MYNACQMKQGEDEPIDQIVTRLKKNTRCSFVGTDREMKDQIVLNCHPDNFLQRKTLRDDLDLQNLVVAARAIKIYK